MKTPQGNHFDFKLEYPRGTSCPFSFGDEVTSPVVDGMGSRHEFTGSAYVIETLSVFHKFYDANAARVTVFVRHIPPLVL